MASTLVSSILDRIAAGGKAYGAGELGSREALIDLSHQLVAALEIPSEYVQRTMWAEVSVVNQRSFSADPASPPGRHTAGLLSTAKSSST